MPAEIQVAGQLVVAAGFLLLAAAGVLSWLSHGFRELLIGRLIGSVVFMATEKTRLEERKAAEERARRERLRGALGVLSEGLAMNLTLPDARVKIEQSLTELGAEGPQELEPKLHYATQVVDQAVTQRRWRLSAYEIRQVMKPIIELVKPLLSD